MAYLVSITPRAERDLGLLYEQVSTFHSEAARKWYLGLKKSILSLETHPNRCQVIRAKGNLRQLLYGHRTNAYRIIYRVLERPKRVEVLHIRHGARQEPRASDLS